MITWITRMSVLIMVAARFDRAIAAAVFDFEDSSDLSLFEWPHSSSVVISGKRYKLGTKSLEWTWSPNDILSLDLSSKGIVNEKVTEGGLKLWIYNEIPKPQKCLTVEVTKTSTCAGKSKVTHSSSFHISLAFNGWRAVWIGYNEFQNCPNPSPNLGGCFKEQITALKIHSPSYKATIPIYLDILRWVDKMSRQSRDSIVPVVTSKCLSCEDLRNVTEQDALAVYERSKFWMQTYRWSITAVPAPTPLSEDVLFQKLSEMKLIEKRLYNWYADEKTSFIMLKLPPGTVYPDGVEVDNFYIRRRWDELMKNIDTAYKKFKRLNLQLTTVSGNEVITGSPLFCRDSGYGKSKKAGGDKKFGFVMHHILFPLALEYHLKSRPLEVSNTACQWAKIYSRGDGKFNDDDVTAITGTDKGMTKLFLKSYKSHIGSETSSAACSGADLHSYASLEFAVSELNKKRKEKLFLLFDYLRDQGWETGSALGSTDHEMNNNGAGFTHSLFLLRKELEETGRLEPLTETLKYYSDFNEIYQDVFEYKGTTADRMRTILIYRLMAALMMPEEDPGLASRPKALAKVRDMENWRRWFNNALHINKGLGGVIKPDYTSFHHHAFYGSAYGPHAIHMATLASYLTEGTSFGILETQRNNLQNALDVLKFASVKYSTPNSIGGRFPSYSKGILAKTAPAFAYLAVTIPKLEPGSDDQKLLEELKESETRSFLRLYDVGSETDCGKGKISNLSDTEAMKAYLCTGKVFSAIYYLNSLGSLQIMQRIKKKSEEKGLSGEDSPQGHWAKNFGAISIHRRDDWAVTMKGFNNFVWDAESSIDQNVFGLYQSHGALQISNGEKNLKPYDIDNGWDWSMIPGTTAISFEVSDLKSIGDRKYNPAKFAGGVTFIGRVPYDSSTSNGAFGMEFSQPSYDLPTGSPLKNVDFKFKKSVVFHDDFLLCIGSKITTRGVTDRSKTRTTLFQDRLADKFTVISDPSDLNVYKCGAGKAHSPGSWGSATSVVLEDSNGNRYFVPRPDEQALYFYPKKEQTSRPESGDMTTTRGMYCAAWFDHGVNMADQQYQYTLKVKSSESDKTAALSDSDYEILQANSKAHVSKISRNTGTTAGPLFTYVIFEVGNAKVSIPRKSPIKTVTGSSCLVMAQLVEKKTLAISVSAPDLNFKRSPDAPSWCPPIMPARPEKNNDVHSEFEFCSESASQEVKVKLKGRPLEVAKIYINGLEQSFDDMNNNDYIEVARKSVKFKNLKNGFTTEVLIKIK